MRAAGVLHTPTALTISNGTSTAVATENPTTDDIPRLDLREQIARIDRAMAENQKFQAEREKLLAEALKFEREREKLGAEARKLERDHWLAPALAIAAVIGGLLGVASFIAKVIS
jgi:hypothetical protein